jgi:hypothetical protein
LFEKVDNLSIDLKRETESIKKGCERDIRKVDERLRNIEKKMWTIAGSLTIIIFMVSPIIQRTLRGALTPQTTSSIIKNQ